MAYIGNSPAELVTELDNAVVTADKLANDAVTAAKIVDGTIIADDLSTGIIVNSKVAANAAIAATKLAISGGSNITLQSDGTFDLDASVDVSTGYSIGGTAIVDSSRNATFVTVGTPAGSASAPAYTFSTDTNTGMFKRGTDQIGFTAGGTEYVAIGSFGLAVDTIQNKASAGDLTLNVAGDIVLDADGGDVILKDNGSDFGRFGNSSQNFIIRNSVSDKDIIFRGNDNSVAVDALTLDMSEAGAATFNSSVTVGGTVTADGLNITTATSSAATLENTGNSGTTFNFDANRSNVNGWLGSNAYKWDGTLVAQISGATGSDTTNKDDGTLLFYTAAAGTILARQKIDNNGDISFYASDGTTQSFHWDAADERLGLGVTAPAAPLSISGSAFNPAAGGYATGGIDLQGATAGNGNYTAGLGFRMGTRQSTAIITGVQDTTDSDRVGLAFFTNPDGSGATAAEEAMRITSGGAVGIGVVPSAWGSNSDAMQIGNSGILFGQNNANVLTVGSNFYWDNTDYKRINADLASRYVQYEGQHIFSHAVTGSADTNISFAESMRINASGRVLIGTNEIDVGFTDSGSGVVVWEDGLLQAARSSPYAVGMFNKLDNDGQIVEFYKDGGLVGSIQSRSGVVSTLILDPRSNGVGLTASSNTIMPTTNTGSLGGVVDLGASGGYAFRDLHLSGDITFGDGHFIGDGNGDNLEIVSGASENILLKSAGGIISFNDASGSNEYARFDTSGALLVGKTAQNSTATGSQLNSDGLIIGTRSGYEALLLNRKTSQGSIATFQYENAPVGSIGVSGGNNLYISGQASNHSGITFGTDVLIPTRQGAATDNITDLGASGNRFKDLYLSGGAYLGGTGSANHLDDYEEGTWTPGTNRGYDSVGYTLRIGSYTKIGNTVRAYCALKLAAGSSSANGQQLRITGLPFTLQNEANTYPVPTLYWNVIVSGGTNATLLAVPNTTTLVGYNQNATNLTEIAGTQAGTGLDVKFTLVYQAA